MDTRSPDRTHPDVAVVWNDVKIRNIGNLSNMQSSRIARISPNDLKLRACYSSFLSSSVDQRLGSELNGNSGPTVR